MDSAKLSEHVSDAKDDEDFLIKYHEITNRLKKRFFRNPNVTEANEQLHALVVRCEQEKAWQCAGMCCSSVSRCFRTLGIIESEINYLSKAGRFFLEADKQSKRIGCPSIDHENLLAASNSFSDAITRCQNESRSNISTTKSMLGITVESASECGQCLKKFVTSIPTNEGMDKIVSAEVDHGDYLSALKLSTELIGWMDGNNIPTLRNRNLYHKATVIRLLLLLIEQPTTQQLPLISSKGMGKFTSVDDIFNTSKIKNEDELLLLKSFVLACQMKDTEAIVELEEELWQYFNTEGKNLLRTVSRNILDV